MKINVEFSLHNHLIFLVIVKASSGPRYVVGVRVKLDKSKLVVGTRVSLDITTLTIMRILPREVDPVIFNMMSEGKSIYENINLILQILVKFPLLKLVVWVIRLEP